MGTVKRKVSTDLPTEKPCCFRISVIACVCAVLSLLVHTYNYVEKESGSDKLNGNARDVLENILDDKLEEKIEAYLSAFTGTTSHRLKRDAMLVSSEDTFCLFALISIL